MRAYVYDVLLAQEDNKGLVFPIPQRNCVRFEDNDGNIYDLIAGFHVMRKRYR